MKGKKGSLFSTFLIAFVIFMVGMITINFLKSPIDQARLDLSCDDTLNITDGTKVMCLFTDSALVYIIILIISLSGGIILVKFI